MTDHDTFPKTGSDRDEDLRPTVLRTIRHHTNPHQRGARRADLSRILG